MDLMTLTFSDVYTDVAEYLGLGSSPTGTDLTKVKDIVYRAYRRFLMPRDANGRRYVWTFLKPSYTLTTKSGEWKYLLPETFRAMIHGFRHTTENAHPSINSTSQRRILQLRNVSEHSSYPYYYAIRPTYPNNTTGTNWEVIFYPTPDTTYHLEYTILIHPKKPTNDSDLFVGGPLASEVILQGALAVAEHQEDETYGVQNQLYMTALEDLINEDKALSAESVGYLWGMGMPHGYRNEYNDITIYGEDI